MNNERLCFSLFCHRVTLLLLSCYVIFTGGSVGRAATVTLLPFYSGWHFYDFGSRPSPDWAGFEFDDSSWSYGFGQFGFGEGDETTIVNSGPPTNRYVTTYFRSIVWLDNITNYSTVSLSLLRDDGAVVYLNGTPVHRSNMPDDEIEYDTFALTDLSYPDATNLDVVTLPASMFYNGPNLIAVEVHLASSSSTNMSFDMSVEASDEGIGTLQIIRGPYLQVGTSSNLVVRWRTSTPSDTRVSYGATAANLNRGVTNRTLVTDHEITLTGLSPATRYYYEIGTTTIKLAGDETYSFVSAPVPGTVQPVRIWAIGDFGSGFPAQMRVRDTYAAFTGSRYTDVWLMLGDNAYYSGLDNEYQDYVFTIYPTLLRQTVAWPTVGNHETGQIQTLSDDYDYYRIFTMPTQGQAGGVPSGTEHYYSFDYANIHFICLDSMTAIYRQPNGAMCQWLKADLEDTTRDWIVVYFHHPAYTKGSHNSDFETDLIEVRQNIVPILEDGGADLVLWGHSHVYERSYLIDRHYGPANSFNVTNRLDSGDGKTNGTGAYRRPAGGLGAHAGTIYITDGSSGGQNIGGALNHEAMFYSTYSAGSVVVDVTGLRMDVTFIRDDGAIPDYFTIDKSYDTNHLPMLSIAKSNDNAVITWPTSIPDYRLETKRRLLQTDAWTASPALVSTNGRRKKVVVPATVTNEFFRLRSLP